MDGRAKMLYSIDFRFFKLLLRKENELLVSEMKKKKMQVKNFVSEIKGMES